MSLSLKYVLAGGIAVIAVGIIVVAGFPARSGKNAGGEIPAGASAQGDPGLTTSRQSADSGLEAIESIIVPQDLPNTPVKVTLGPGDETVDSVEGWQLQHLGTGRYRIVDPLGIQRASGSEQAMRKSFEVVRSQYLD